MTKHLFICLVAFICFNTMTAQETVAEATTVSSRTPSVLYGTASYYADKFNGRRTANGEIFNQQKMTAACNVLPLGTWIRVTNLRNGRSVVVKVNDRLHQRMTRVVDLSKTAAKMLGYTGHGLAKVKVEPFGRKKPSL